MAATSTTYPRLVTARLDVSPWVIAGTVMLATFMEVLDTSVANVSLPHIAGSMSATTDEATWVLTAYLVANAIVLPLSGWFSTLFGRKRFYMACVALFTVSSALCGVAPSLTALIFFRVCQGLGGGALQPISQAILRETFPRERQGMAMAVYGMGVVFAPVIGPTLGGWITDNFTWRWIFLINIPVGIFALLMNGLLLADPPYLVRRSVRDGLRIDYIGIGLIATGLGFLEVMLDLGQREDWFASDLIIAATILAAVCLTAVVFWEVRQKDPVVELHLLKERNFMISTILMFALGFILYSSTALLPIFLQNLLGYSAMRSGMALSPGGIVIMFMMPIVGALVGRYQPRWLVIVGLAGASAGMFIMSRFTLDIPFSSAVNSRIVQSIGFAFLFVPINTVAFYYIPRPKVSYATGLINLARNIGGSAGIALITTLLARRAQFHQGVLVSHLTPFDPIYQAALHNAAQMAIRHGADPVQAATQAQGMIYGMVQRQASMLAFADCFWLMAVAFLLLIPLMFIMRDIRGHKAEMIVE